MNEGTVSALKGLFPFFACLTPICLQEANDKSFPDSTEFPSLPAR